MQIIGILLSLGGLVCFIMVLIKQFQNAGAVHGIIGIVTCGIWTFVWGWMNAGNLNIKNIMTIWTIVIIACIVFNVMFGSFYAMPRGLPTNSTP
ncbi:MAG: hypothetical protein ACREBG_06350 [Pyrinomonadaceae bacterium]